MTDPASPLSFGQKLSVATRAWFWFVAVNMRLGRQPLPRFVRRLGGVGRPREDRVAPARLSRGVFRSLRLGPLRPRCLIRALVLYRLLREQGEDAELVIGLPVTAVSEEAHAWVEIDHVDLGPPPGRSGHVELARYS
jgi:hypothetical protein